MHIHKKKMKGNVTRARRRGGCPELSWRSPRTAAGEAGGGPGAITAMSAENAPVFGMLVRLQVNQHGPVGGLGVALGLFWARRTNRRGHISLYRPLQHLLSTEFALSGFHVFFDVGRWLGTYT